MSPATLLGQQAGPLGPFLEWGLWEGLSSFRGTGTGVLKEVGLILTQPLPGCGTYLLNIPSRTAEGWEIASVGWLHVQVSPQISNYWLRARQPLGIILPYRVIHAHPSGGPALNPSRHSCNTVSRHFLSVLVLCLWGRDEERGTGDREGR